jgi:hypothetical protein
MDLEYMYKRIEVLCELVVSMDANEKRIEGTNLNTKSKQRNKH